MARMDLSSRLRPGDQLGQYQLLAQVGVGGMGRVWAARRVGVLPAKQLVAIKTGLGELGGGPEFERLFMDEARIASLIDHPNVCGLYELGEERGVLYLAMEWSDGATLREVLDHAPGQRMDPIVAARIVANVCAGLHAAHELEDGDGTPLNVVHRDVSPQNVLIACNGHVKVADFGVAKARGQLHRPTETGEVKGKLSYMAPEQVTSKEIDRRADVFALGCMLYECTVGCRPYHGGDALATLYQLLEQEVTAPSALVEGYPADLEPIVLHALAKDPARRFSTAEQLGRALELWLSSRQAIVNETQVAALIEATVGDQVRAKAALITEAITELDDAIQAQASSKSRGSTRRRPEEPADSGAASSSGGESAGPTVRPLGTADRGYPPRRASGLGALRGISAWLSGLALILVAVVGVLAAEREQGRARPAGQGMQAEPGASAVAVAEPPTRRIRIAVSAEPSAATLEVDGRAVGNPWLAEVLPDGSRHRITASAPGHVSETRMVLFSSPQEILIPLGRELRPADEPRSTPANPVLRLPATPAPPSAVTSRPEARSARQAGQPPTQHGGQVRPLDEDNPFSVPP